MKLEDPRNELITCIPALRAFAINLARDESEADDLVQETIMTAWSKFDRFKPGTNLQAWLFTILRNIFYSQKRKRRREVGDPDGAFSRDIAEKPAHDGRLQMKDFQAAFRTLPDEQREALILVGASGFSYEEAAEMCEVAVGTIKSRANRGRKRLAELLDLDETSRVELTDRATDAVVKASKGSAFR